MESDAVRERIIHAARDRFLTLGFSKVTMDELAFDLGMSKRTLYRHFPGKRELLRHSMLAQVERVSIGLERIMGRDSTSMERLSRVLVMLHEELPGPSGRALADIRRNAPDIWEEVDRRRVEVVRGHFRRLIEDGRAEGTVRQDIDPDLFLLILVTLIQRLVNPETLVRLPLTAPQLLEEIIRLLSIGILTDTGRRDYRAASRSES